MATASLLQIQRLALFYCYLGKGMLASVEILWWYSVRRSTERQVWSENFGLNNPSALRHYEILNQNPSLLVGLRRTLFMVGILVAFVAVGFSQLDAKWARWAGVMLGIELTLRLVLHLAWLRLPGTGIGRRFREQLDKRWPTLREKLRKSVGEKSQELERVPYRKSLDVDLYSFFVRK